MLTQAAGPALRWTRAALVAAVAMLFGVTAHVSAEGLLPGPAALTVLAAALLVPAARLLSRPASAVRVVLLLVAGQTFTHVFLTLTAGHAGQHHGAPPTATPSPTPEPVAAVGGRESLYDQLYADRPAAPPARVTLPEPVQHLVADLGAHAPMALAHLVAAAGVGLWLAYGERLLWQLVALSAPAWRQLGATVASAVRDARAALVASLGTHRRLLPRRPVTAPDLHSARPPVEVGLAASVVRRGPPQPLRA